MALDMRESQSISSYSPWRRIDASRACSSTRTLLRGIEREPRLAPMLPIVDQRRFVPGSGAGQQVAAMAARRAPADAVPSPSAAGLPGRSAA
jgi:hypothetical protein